MSQFSEILIICLFCICILFTGAAKLSPFVLITRANADVNILFVGLIPESSPSDLFNYVPFSLMFIYVDRNTHSMPMQQTRSTLSLITLILQARGNNKVFLWTTKLTFKSKLDGAEKDARGKIFKLFKIILK